MPDDEDGCHAFTAIQLGYELLLECPAAPHIARLPDLAGPIEAFVAERTRGCAGSGVSLGRAALGRALLLNALVGADELGSG